jgi:hypothetical protein
MSILVINAEPVHIYAGIDCSIFEQISIAHRGEVYLRVPTLM